MHVNIIVNGVNNANIKEKRCSESNHSNIKHKICAENNNIMIKHKRCSKCRVTKPISNYYFIVPKQKYSSHCKDCAEIYNAHNHKTYKMDWHKKERKVCNGAFCRGEKEFTSKGGAHYCNACTNYKNNMEDWY